MTAGPDFTGTWARNSSLKENVTEGLIERGVSPKRAALEADGPYIQKWARKEGESNTWKVTTYGENKTIRRELDYTIGEWQEPFWGTSLLFGNVEGSLDRTTSLLEEPYSDSELALVTITTLPGRGKEESRRYIKNGQLILRRTFWPLHDASFWGIVSKEVFVRVPERTARIDVTSEGKTKVATLDFSGQVKMLEVGKPDTTCC